LPAARAGNASRIPSGSLVKLDDALLRGEARQPQRHIFEHLPSDAGNERPLGGLREVFLRFRLINARQETQG
jgi:hypothetical protein